MASVLPGLWFFRYSAPQPMKRSLSTQMYLGVAVQGRKRMRVDNTELLYDRLSYLVLRGETSYEAAPVEASAERPYLALGLSLPPELVVRTLIEVADAGGEGPPSSPSPAFVSPLDAPLVDALCRLLRCLDEPLSRRVLAPLIVREIIFRLLCTEAAAVLRQSASRGGDGGKIHQAMAYIEANAHRRLSVGSLAKRAAMSPSHFAHRFREVASLSPMRYQKLVRLERARELLLGQGLPPAQVADRVGYASASHFSRDFKRHFGLAPGGYAHSLEASSAAPSRPEPAATPA